MSRFTSSPFHRPSPFDFPRPPLSPPETDTDVVPPSHVPTSISVAGGMGISHEMDMSAVTDTPGSRLRRGPSIAYHHSSLRESRDKTIQRSTKSFIIVIPPVSFAQERGQLGHTLASGPSHRLNQGILMPLFPTMYGQLTAIAREFNFPSTTGVCLYLRFTENGVTISPRLADDNWPFIWAHALESSSPSSGHRLPISGTVEFDLDLRYARWYGAWISTVHREHADVPMSVNHSPAPSVAHYRGDSRTTIADVLGGDDPSDIQSHHRPGLRHVPRKLSLVDRFDTMSVRSFGRPASRALSPPEPAPVSQALSPVFQEDEPKTARIDLEHRVKTWRASASLKPSALAATGQVSLEPANLPNTVPIDDESIPTENEPINLEDFAWSVSSVGPGDYEIESHASEFAYYRLPSPDLAHRMLEDVPPTPTTATSWGPSSYPPSILDYDHYGRAPSVDIAHRGLFSRPVTPVTATSWGPSEASWPPSPIAESVQLSVHMADRGAYSRPVTPGTATTWGAPLSWPPSPVIASRVQTPDAGQRSFDEHQVPLSYSAWKGKPWEHVWPYSGQQEFKKTLPWNHVWPYNKGESSSQENAAAISGPWKQVWPYRGVSEGTQPWKQVWPYRNASEDAKPWGQVWPYRTLSEEAKPWAHVWPYTTQKLALSARVSPRDSSPEGSQHTAPWTKVWPYHQSSDALGQSGPWNKVWPYQQPQSAPWKYIWPSIDYSSNVSGRLSYPHFDLYPAVNVHTKERKSTNAYPHFDLYPKLIAKARGEASVNLPASYPVLAIYPAVYPHNLQEIYPRTKFANSVTIPRSQVSFYPRLEIYPQTSASYPYFDIYPVNTAQKPKQTHKTGYPHFDIYPANATTGYPHFDIYPRVSKASKKGVTWLKQSGYPHFDIYPSKENMSYPHFDIYPAKRTTPRKTPAKSGYPHFDLYPTMTASKGYPYFDLYPALKRTKLALHSSGYPHFNIYPAVSKSGYPHLCIYPPGTRTTQSKTPSKSGYPRFDIYPEVSYQKGYPHFDIYPAIKRTRSVSKANVSGYPHFNIYPSPSVARKPANNRGYPNFVLYPPVTQHRQPSLETSGYPHFDIYPRVNQRTLGYPHFDIYPRVKQRTSGYPHFDIYPRVKQRTSGYPHFDIYPRVKQRTSGYPHFDIYPHVKQTHSGYPHFDIYPAVSRQSQTARKPAACSIVRYPMFCLYPAVYPHFNLYPHPPVAGLSPGTTHPNGRAPTPARLVKSSSRLSHSELHAVVMMEIGSTRNPPPPRRQPKSHRELHSIVFVNGIVSTPSGNIETPTHTIVSRMSGTTGRRMSVSQTSSPSSSTLRRVPPTNGGVSRLSAAFNESVTKNDPPKVPVPQRLQGEQNRTSVSFPRPSMTHSLNRSASMALPRSSAIEPEGRVDRSLSTSSVPRPAPRRRDSLVLQRIKAINGEDTSTDALSKFPMPSRPPMPSMPKSLDRSRYPFGS